MADEWTIQISVKLPDGTLINIRGDQLTEVLEKLGQLAEHSGPMADSLKLMSAAGAAVNAASQPPPPPASAPAAANWTPPQPQAQPAAAQPGSPPHCSHGPREYKSGVGKRGPWAGWSCTQPKGQSCPMQWIN